MRLIDADALFEDCLSRLNRFDTTAHEFENCYPYWIFNKAIKEAQTIDAEPVRHGRWVYGITLNHEWRKCSECLVSQDICGCFTYCPNCGAKMDGGEKE